MTIPIDQNRPPAGPLGQYYAQTPACEQLAWSIILPSPDAPYGGFLAQYPHPDGGEPITAFEWKASKPGETRTDAESAVGSFGVCKDEGATLQPLLTHEAHAALFPAMQSLNLTQVTTGLIGGALLCIALCAFIVDYRTKDNTDPLDSILDEIL